VDTRADNVFSSIVIFNPHGHAIKDVAEIALNIPETIQAFELLDAGLTAIPHEFIGTSNAVLANLLLRKSDLRDTIGTISEGRVAGAAIVSVKVTRQGATITIDAILDNKAQPNIREWQQAEAEIARYEADPTVTDFHVLAHTPKASTIRFVTPEIPALGWRVIWVRGLSTPTSSATTINPLIKPFLPLALRLTETKLGANLLAMLDTGDKNKVPFVIENEFFRVEAVLDGTLTVTDKRTNTFFSGLNRFVDGGDAGDEYNYSPPTSDSISALKPVTIKVKRNQLIATLEITTTLNVPAQLTPNRKSRSTKMVAVPVTSRISLAPGIPRIDIHTEVDNHAKDHRLRVHFPAPFAVDNAHHDGHFEVVNRPLGVPQASEKWVESPRPETHQNAFTTVSNGKVGLTIANRGLPEVEVIPGTQTEIAITLLRCVGWLSRDDLPTRQGHAGPGFETSDAQMSGKWEFDYSIIPHQGDWKDAFLQAYAVQTRLRAIETGIHPGELQTVGNFISSSPAEFVISAVKAADDGNGWIVRGYNISSETIQVILKPLHRFTRVAQVNLAEKELAPLEWDDQGGVVIRANKHEVITIKFSK
jgi:hypothetical protein